MTRAEFEQYCVSIRDTGIWGGEPEILALSRAYNIPIHVIQGGNPPVVVHNPTGAPQEENLREKKVLRISYHRRMYGLGEVRIIDAILSVNNAYCSTALQLAPTK